MPRPPATTGSEPAESRFVSAIVLAAGSSSRLGRPKQFLPLDGKCMLQHVVDAAIASRLGEVVVVLGHRADEVEDALELPSDGSARVVVNGDHASGQSTSLRVGLAASDPRATAAAVLLGDQPEVGAELIDLVVARFEASELPIARPVYVGARGETIPGHPVVLARRVWAELEAVRGDSGARAVLSARPERVLEVAVDGPPPADVDTADDYERAVAKDRR